MKDQDRRTLLAMILALATYYVWSVFFIKPPEPAEIPVSGAPAVGTPDGTPAGTPGVLTAPAAQPAPDFSCTDARTTFGSAVRFELSDCGGIRKVEIPGYEAAIQVTPWWTWIWGRVTGTHSGGWAPYHSAGTAQNLASGRFAEAGAGDPLLASTGLWKIQPGTGESVEASYTTPNGVLIRRVLSATAEPDIYDLSWRWEAPAGAQGPFWVGLQEELVEHSDPYSPHLRLAAVVDGSLEQLYDPADAAAGLVWDGPVSWIGLEDRYFLAALQPQDALTDVRIATDAGGLTRAWVRATKESLTPGESVELRFRLYVGPKDVERMAALGGGLEEAANLGIFGFFSKILLFFLDLFYLGVKNWGIAIILTTLTLKIIFVPFTLAASKSAKRMAKLQPELQGVREKYKDNPRKQQEATMALFKTHKVNPVGGCLPILITIPFFMGFFTMLQSTAELRFSPFLWATDLAASDTIGHLFGLPINIMPLLMGATMVYQMRLTPTPSMDPAQAKMMQFMPIIFTLFCYTFSCALSLYSTVNGLFTIIQQLVINRMKDEPLTPAVAAVSPGGKPVKNVTPKKK